MSCKGNKNVIQGSVTFFDTLGEELNAINALVYIYPSIAVFDDDSNQFLDLVNTGTSGYYSFFDLHGGPYYLYAAQRDTNGFVIRSDGGSADVEGNETKIFDMMLH